MAADESKVSVSRKEIYEIKIGEREPISLTHDEAAALHRALSSVISPNTGAPSKVAEAESKHEYSAPSQPETHPAPRRVIRTDPERRARQTMVMAAAVLIIIGGFFAAYDISTGSHAVSGFKPPAKPYVHFEIVAGSGGTLTFNGTSPGPALTAPVNVTVWVSFTVATDSGQQHSWVLVPGNVSHNNPAPDFTPVFPNASTPNPTVGDAVGSTYQIVFKPTKVGTYLYICEVPGHFLSGMWGYFNVTANNTTASSVPHVVQSTQNAHVGQALMAAEYNKN